MKPSDQLPKIIIDQKAETALEIMAQTPHKRCWVDRLAKEMVASGKWERVYKRVGGRLTPAYRVRQK